MENRDGNVEGMGEKGIAYGILVGEMWRYETLWNIQAWILKKTEWEVTNWINLGPYGDE